MSNHTRFNTTIPLLVEPEHQDEQTGQSVTPGQRDEQGNVQMGLKVTLGAIPAVVILILVSIHVIVKKRTSTLSHPPLDEEAQQVYL